MVLLWLMAMNGSGEWILIMSSDIRGITNVFFMHKHFGHVLRKLFEKKEAAAYVLRYLLRDTVRLFHLCQVDSCLNSLDGSIIKRRVFWFLLQLYCITMFHKKFSI